MVDSLQNDAISPRKPFRTPDVDVRNWFRCLLEDSSEADENTSESAWAELQNFQDEPLRLHIISLVDDHRQPQLHRAFQEAFGEPFLPAPIRHLVYQIEFDVRHGLHGAFDLFLPRYGPSDPEDPERICLIRYFTMATLSSPEYSHWWFRNHFKPELHPMWVSICQMHGLDGEGTERCAPATGIEPDAR